MHHHKEMVKIEEKKNNSTMNYRITKCSGQLFSMWPLNKNTKWFYPILFKIFSNLLIFNDIFFFFGLSIGLYHFYNDIPIFTTVIFILLQLTSICENISTLIFCKIRKQKIQVYIGM